MGESPQTEASEAGLFGRWIWDAQGLPGYLYTTDQDRDAWARTDTTWGSSTDHFFQLGNDRLTATGHNGGYLQVLESSRGFCWLTHRDPKANCLGGGIAFIWEEGAVWSDAWDPDRPEEMKERLFGMGYARKVKEHQGLRIEHTLTIPFSDDPVVVSAIRMTNLSDRPRSFVLYDYWGVNLLTLKMSLVVTSHGRKKFGKNVLLQAAGRLAKGLGKMTGMDTDSARARFSSQFRFEQGLLNRGVWVRPIYEGSGQVSRSEESGLNTHPLPLFHGLLRESYDYAFTRRAGVFRGSAFHPEEIPASSQFRDPCLMLGKCLRLDPHESTELVFLFGACEEDQMEFLVSKYESWGRDEEIARRHGQGWKSSMVDLSVPGADWLHRETQWHAYSLRSAAYFDEHFQCHKVPQGSAYEFCHGFDGAVRDFVFFLYPLIFISPSLAREFLIYILKLMRPDGSLPYGVYGVGKTVGAIIHEDPSDASLFVLWGILEYVSLTRDFGILDQDLPFLGNQGSATGRRRMELLVEYLFSEKVGLGAHGAIRARSGDWSDGISFMVKSRRRFVKHGESLFNTAMAIALFERFDALLDRLIPDKVASLRAMTGRLKEAAQKAWQGQWFLRGWDGSGGAIGDQSIFLEHHTWLLIGQWLPASQTQSVIQAISEKLDDPARTGPFVLHPPVKTLFGVLPPGWDVNGGVWHAMNGLLTWGYALHDQAKAWRSLRKNSMANRAIHYPHLWYGIWSGPDSVIADYAEEGGQAFYHLPTPMRDWPLMNMNLHASWLSSALRILGIEGTLEGLRIDPHMMGQSFRFRSPLMDLEVEPGATILRYRAPQGQDLQVAWRCPDGAPQRPEVTCSSGGRLEGVEIEGGWLKIRVTRECPKELAIEIRPR